MDAVHLDRFGTEMKEKSVGLKLDTNIWGESHNNDFSRALWQSTMTQECFGNKFRSIMIGEMTSKVKIYFLITGSLL